MPNSSPPLVVGPVQPSERIEALDILRGWAVFGIFLVDVDITFRMWSVGGVMGLVSGTDRVLAQLHYLFLGDKFWTLFSFLFGLGFSLQLVRAESRGTTFVRFYWRRLALLLMMGLANQMFLLQAWRGDALQQYAIVGFVLLAFRRCSSRNLLLVALLCTLINPVRSGLERAIHDRRLAEPQTAQQVIEDDARRARTQSADRDESHQLRREGAYWTLVGKVAKSYGVYADPSYYLQLIGRFLPLFLLGLYAGRRRIFESLPAHLPFIRRVMWWGLGLGLASSLLLVTTRGANPAWLDVTRMIVGAVGHPALAFFYAAGVVLLAQRAGWRTRLAPFAAVGRMSLTNYLLQGVVLAVACPGYGLGLYDRLSVPAAWCLAFVVFAGEVFISVWWMGRFRFGPVEWLWRTLTYGKRPTMRMPLTVTT